MIRKEIKQVVIARDAELRQLTEMLARAEAGSGGLLLLAGEAGVGKTTLASAAMANSGLRSVDTAASSSASTPYAPVTSVLRELVRDEPGLVDELGPLRPWLHTLLPELGAAPAPADKASLFESIRCVLEAAGQQQPTVVLLDDLQWADAATLDLLPALAGWVEDMPLCVLAVYRSEEIRRDHPLRRARADLRRARRLRELIVNPFDGTATAALVNEIVGDQTSADLIELVHDRSQGVPFLVEELAGALLAAGSLVPGVRGLELQGGIDLPLPESVRDVVRMRLEVLSDQAVATLQAAAVIGREADLGLLAELGEDAGVDEAVEHGFLIAGPGVVRFRHDLTREAVYSDTPWPRQRTLHARAATILPTRAPVPPQVVAEHWLAAGSPATARPLLIDGATSAVGLHAHRDATQMLRAALEVWPIDEDPPERHAALRQLALSARACGELADSARAWEELIAELPPADPLAAAEALAGLASVYELLHGFDKAIRTRVLAAERFREGERAADAAGQLLTVAWRVALRDSTQALPLLNQAADSASKAQREDLEVRCASLRAFILGLDGAREEATAGVQDSLRSAIAGGHIDEAVEAQWVLGTLANHWGDYSLAESSFGSAVEACQQRGIKPMESTCQACLGIALFNRGEWKAAIEIERSVLSDDRRPDAEEHALLVLGLIAAARGSSRRARSLLSRAAALARPARPHGSTVLQSLAGLALLDELDGVDDDRWRGLVESQPESMRQNYALWVRRATTFAAKNGDLGLAKQSADVLAAWATRFGTAETLAAFAHALGEIALLEGEPRAAADQFTRAVELLVSLDAPFELASTRTRAAAALDATGDRDRAADQLVAAYRSFRKLQARPFYTQVAAQLDAMGQPVDRRLGRRAAADLANAGLTRREREVLKLVALGHTNRDVATSLVVSTRTVDMHVRNVLMKLGARTRTEAVARAGELGLLTTPDSRLSGPT